MHLLYHANIVLEFLDVALQLLDNLLLGLYDSDQLPHRVRHAWIVLILAALVGREVPRNQ